VAEVLCITVRESIGRVWMDRATKAVRTIILQ
jgi:hypothetical protein